MEKLLDMLQSSDKEMVNLGITLLCEEFSYDEMIMITSNIPYFNIIIMYDIFEGKVEWELRHKSTRSIKIQTGKAGTKIFEEAMKNSF